VSEINVVTVLVNIGRLKSKTMEAELSIALPIEIPLLHLIEYLKNQ